MRPRHVGCSGGTSMKRLRGSLVRLWIHLLRQGTMTACPVRSPVFDLLFVNLLSRSPEVIRRYGTSKTELRRLRRRVCLYSVRSWLEKLRKSSCKGDVAIGLLAEIRRDCSFIRCTPYDFGSTPTEMKRLTRIAHVAMANDFLKRMLRKKKVDRDIEELEFIQFHLKAASARPLSIGVTAAQLRAFVYY